MHVRGYSFILTHAATDDDHEIDDVTIIEDLSDIDGDNDNDFFKDENSTRNDNSINKMISITVKFLLIFRVVYNIPDHGIVLLLKFFRFLIAKIMEIYKSPAVNYIVNIPLSIHGCYSLLGLKETPFRQYTVCPSCHLLYNADTLLSSHRRTEEIKCSFVEFPDHPQARYRLPCNSRLFDKVQKKHAVQFKSRKLYYYYGLKLALENLTARPKFLELCNRWLYNSKDNLIFDVTDGKIWKSLVSLLSPNRIPTSVLGILINVDWFQPFKHVSYSVGVIYAVIINLPRSIRYANENIIIIGIIPGPKEPKKHINSYLGPFVSELLELFNGL